MTKKTSMRHLYRKARLIPVIAIILALSMQATVSAACITEDAVPGSSFKPYMSHTAITDKGSPQYALQQIAGTDENGLRKLRDRYMVAMGAHYGTSIGQEVDIALEDGTVLPCILGDVKAPKDTDPTCRVGRHNDTIEFIVDISELHEGARARGDVSVIPGFAGCVRTVTVTGTRSALPTADGTVPTDPLMS